MPKEKVNAAAINTGRDSRLLDHLAPLCSLLQVPLFLTEEKNQILVEKFYPEITSHYIPTEEFSLFTLAEKYQLLIQSTFWDQELISLLKSVYPHVRFGYCPHGNSDKGHQKPMMEPILWQDFAFLYGEHMVERLKKQNLWKNLPKYIFTGNYRYEYYQKNRSFYNALMEKELSDLNPQNVTILYAPTWNDEENSTSFFTACKILVEQVPANYNLIIKTHPLLEEMDPVQYYRSLPEITSKANVFLLEEFPPIFPLLSKVDILLGDASSIGYDFLQFEKPMFFFNPFKTVSTDHPSLYLHQCGIIIPEANYKGIFEFIEKNLPRFDKDKQRLQKKIWDFAFGKEKKSDCFTLTLYKKLF